VGRKEASPTWADDGNLLRAIHTSVLENKRGDCYVIDPRFLVGRSQARRVASALLSVGTLDGFGARQRKGWKE